MTKVILVMGVVVVLLIVAGTTFGATAIKKGSKVLVLDVVTSLETETSLPQAALTYVEQDIFAHPLR